MRVLATTDQTRLRAQGKNVLRTLVEQVREKPVVGVRGTRLLHPEVVARFVEARAFRPHGRCRPPGSDPLKANMTTRFPTPPVVIVCFENYSEKLSALSGHWYN
jgi:hypothetical protein